MKQDTSFIENLLKANSKWSRPTDALVDSPLWEEGWTNANDIVRDNLAHGWLACFEESLNDMSQSDTYKYIRQQLVLRHEWFHKIQPYVRREVIENTSLPAIDKLLVTLLVGNEEPQPTEVSLRKLWFGTEDEKLKSLLELPTRNSFVREYGMLVPLLAWKASRLPSASSEHKAQAAVFSATAGFNSIPEPDYSFTDPSDRMWHQLGAIADSTDDIHAAKILYEKYYSVIQSLPPSEVAKPLGLLVRLASIHDVNLVKRVVPNTIFSITCPNGTVYDVLRDWIPQRAEALMASESIGLSTEEALALISQEVVGISDINLELPDTVYSSQQL